MLLLAHSEAALITLDALSVTSSPSGCKIAYLTRKNFKIIICSNSICTFHIIKF